MSQGAITLEEANRFASDNGRYEFVQVLGSGSFGTVLLARDRHVLPPGQHVVGPGRHSTGPEAAARAVKLIKARGTLWQMLFRKKPQKVKGGQQEANMLLELRHPHVLEFFEKYEFNKLKWFGIGIVTEFCNNGNLQSYLEKHGRPNWSTRLVWYKQLASAMEFIHSEGVVHRDLKPENVLVDAKKELKVADVGLARVLWDTHQEDGGGGARGRGGGGGRGGTSNSHGHARGGGGPAFVDFMTSAAGTPLYMAPECWDDHCGQSVDVFSLGLVFVVIAECPARMMPLAKWNGKLLCVGMVLHQNEEARNVDTLKLLHPRVVHVYKQERTLLQKMLVFNPLCRPTMKCVHQELQTMKVTKKSSKPAKASVPRAPRYLVYLRMLCALLVLGFALVLLLYLFAQFVW